MNPPTNRVCEHGRLIPIEKRCAACDKEELSMLKSELVRMRSFDTDEFRKLWNESVRAAYTSVKHFDAGMEKIFDFIEANIETAKKKARRDK